uniref:Uncharacterized protein n=1 Tax=Meloidogyne hapla TaxID=6305 RepID=A0A1I8B739_MELHA
MLRVVISKFCCAQFKTLSVRSLSDLHIDVDRDKLTKNFKQVMIKDGIKKKKVIVIDPKFNGLSLVEQHKFVTDLFPDNFNDYFDLETRGTLDDNEIRRVEIKKYLFGDLSNETPQSLLNSAISHFDMGQGILASHVAWLACSLQLTNFLLYYGFEADDHKLKRLVKDFLLTYCNEKTLFYQLSSSWDGINRFFCT